MSIQHTLGEFKRASKGRKLRIWCSWQRDDGAYFPITRAKFLRTIGADVPHDQGGLHENTAIDFAYGQDGDILIG